MSLSKLRAVLSARASISVAAWLAAIALGFSISSHAGTNVWTEVGPDVASISRVEFAAGGDSVAFARGGDKFWKSTDAGRTWTVLQRNNTYDYPFALDRGDPNFILLAGPTGPLLRSSDGGATFSPVAFNSPYALAFGTDGVAYASAPQNPRVWRSTNRGQTWTGLSPTNLPTTGVTLNHTPVAYDIEVDPTDSNRVYLGYRHPDYAGIYRSTDGGASWLSSTGLAGISAIKIAIHPTTTARLFAATPVGLFASSDSGATWARVSDATGSGVASANLASVAIDPSQPQVVYAGGEERGELFRSTDGGLTWSRRDNGIFAGRIASIAPRPNGSGEVLAGTSHTMYGTTDGGAHWSASAQGIKASSVTAVSNGNKLRIGLYDGGIYESVDGAAWTPLNNAGLRARVQNQRLSPVVEIREAARLFVSLQQDGVFSSTDGGATWLPQPPSYSPWNRHVWGGFITERGQGPVHYAGTSSGVFKTSNDGDTWTIASAGITMPTIMALAKNTDGTQLFAGTFNGGVFRSTDGGMNWTAANNGLTNLEIKTLAYDDSGSNALIVGSNHGLFVSRDAGASYTRLTDALGPGVQPSIDAILVEDFQRGSLYVAYQKRIFRSVDSGQTWMELSAGNPMPMFRTIHGLVGDGPGVLYLGASYTGLHQYSVSPDMQIIAQAPTPGTFPVGTQFPWQAQVRNNGPVAATFGRLSWQLGANTSVISPTATRGLCSVASQLLTCDFGVMQPGDSADVNMQVRGISGGPVRIQAMGLAAEPDLNPSNSTFSNAGVRIVEQVDLSVTLSATAATVPSGETFDYVVTVRNDGPTIATGGELETNFDANDLYALTAGSSDGCTGAAAGVLRCPLPPIAAGQSTTFRWTVTAVPGGRRSASAVVRSNPENSEEADTSDNAASTTLEVIAANDLSIELVRPAGAVIHDNEFNYVLTVRNNGLIPSDEVRARLTLSNLVSYVSASGASCSIAAAVVTCELGTLAPLASGTITVTVRATTVGAALASSEVSGSNPDPHPSNNTARTEVTINTPTPPPPPPASGGSGRGGGGGGLDYGVLLLGVMLAMARRRRGRLVTTATALLSRKDRSSPGRSRGGSSQHRSSTHA